MLGPISQLALALTAALAAPAGDRETLVETWPDGSKRVEREVVAGEGGEPVNDGKYRSWHANGEEEARGRYEEGRRHGKWRLWYEDGTRRAIGKYERGLRVGEWEAWLPDGSVDASLAGTYVAHRGTSPDGFLVEGEVRDGVPHGAWAGRWPGGALFAQGELRGGVPEGPWTFGWPGGPRMAEGGFAAGERDGPWRFWHPDGAFDPRMGSGMWRRGVRLGELGAEEGGADAAEPPAALEAPPVAAADEAAERLRAVVERLLLLPANDRGVLLSELRVQAREALPLLLAELCALDLGVPAQAERARSLHELLPALVPAPSSAWSADAGAAALAANRRTLRRWLSLEAMTRENERFWALELRLARDETDFLLAPPLDPRGLADGVLLREVAGGRSLGRTGRYDLRFGERARGTPVAKAKAEARALERALAWLVAHQLPSGAWSADGFAARCGSVGAGACDGTGWPEREVGLTGLALLALLGDGNTTEGGPHRDAVLRGVSWLLAQQDAEGALGHRHFHDFVYRHAIATTALAEAAALSGDERMLEAVRRAAGFIVRIRNPYSAWRYGVPGNGEDDTSVTGWMVAALVAAHEAGVELDAASVDGALSFLDEVTDPSSGRVGYEEYGTTSSRIVGYNDHYPRDRAETLTAVALTARLALGQDPAELPVLMKHADLIRRSLPGWDDEGFLVDQYYWYHATVALHQLAPRKEGPWEAWRAALFPLLLEHQRQDGDWEGSWDPVGPWGFAGGRVYSTALLALCLETEYRHRRWLER